MKKIWIVCFIFLSLVACESNDAGVNESVNEAVNEENVVEELIVEEEVEEALEKVKVDIEILNFRSQPSADSDKLGEVYQGCVYEVLKTKEVEKGDKTEIWYLVKVGDEVGWIAGWYTVSTEETPKDFLVKDLSYDFKDFYNVGDPLDLPEDESMAIVLNDAVIDENFVFTEAGMYEAKLQYSDKLGRTTESEKIHIQVVDNLTFRIYKDYTKDVAEDRVVKLDELEFTGSIIVYDGIWYECESLLYKGYIKPEHGLYPLTEVTEVVVADAEKVLQEDYILQTDGNENCLHLENGFGGHTFIHIPSGEIVDWPYAYEFKNQNQLLLYMLPFHFHQVNKQETESFKLYELSSEAFELLYETDDSFAYLEVLEDGTYRSGRISNDTWYSTNHAISHEIVDVVNVDGNWQLSVISTPIIKEDKPFDLYSDMSKDNFIRSYKPSQVVKIESTDIYDIIDNELVMWFKVYIPDGGYAYAYRPRWAYERESILITKDFYLKLENGDTVKFEGAYDDFYLVRDLTDTFVLMNAYAVTSSYEGSYTQVLSRKSGEIIKDFSDTVIHSFPAGDKLLFEKWSYGGSYFKLELYDIEGNELSEVFVYESETASISSLDVIDDNLIEFIIEADESYPSSLKYLDGEWTVTTSYSE
ncbi:hypothetical protein EZV73_03160 [Acidaminobacter sp. JC074]|uniref:SH3 domain-containing protein n=1 Tax=Acidaminobacter sp. JC074 TaxID=2530199 RepID=UPI001F0DCF84|nr:SH3 domain-containing protein [Acidaminobacter sp. JC074]MCH4886548.1 hypothetical protein [Acidaminobacter sp. JC074]